MAWAAQQHSRSSCFAAGYRKYLSFILPTPAQSITDHLPTELCIPVLGQLCSRTWCLGTDLFQVLGYLLAKTATPQNSISPVKWNWKPPKGKETQVNTFQPAEIWVGFHLQWLLGHCSGTQGHGSCQGHSVSPPALPHDLPPLADWSLDSFTFCMQVFGSDQRYVLLFEAHTASVGQAAVLLSGSRSTQPHSALPGFWNEILTVTKAPMPPSSPTHLYKVSPRGRMERSWLAGCKHRTSSFSAQSLLQTEIQSHWVRKGADNLFIMAHLIPAVSTPNCAEIFHYCYYILKVTVVNLASNVAFED